VVEAAETVGGEAVGGEAAGAVPWERQGRVSRYLRAVGTVRTRSARGSDRAADRWAQRFDIFLELSKPAQTWKLKTDALRCSKNFQIVHATRSGHYKQFSQLCRHLNINIIRVKIHEQIHHLKF
jgi:hypothetical protein